jgi:hypothetical protein
MVNLLAGARSAQHVSLLLTLTIARPAQVISDDAGVPKGWAFITFCDARTAGIAIQTVRRSWTQSRSWGSISACS